MGLPALKIDPEFRDKIPPLAETELKQLEDNILNDGEVTHPIITWNDTIIDGHHRWQIIQKHPEIPFKVKQMDFADKWAAIVWMCQNQIGRRNVTDIQKQVLIAQEYEAQKKTISNILGINQFSPLGGENLHQANSKAPKTRAVVATAHNITEGAVKAAVELNNGLDAAESISPGFKDSILTGAVKAPKSTIAAIAKLDDEQKKQAVTAIKNGERFKPPTKEPELAPADTSTGYNSDDLKTELDCCTETFYANFKSTLVIHSTMLQQKDCKKKVIAALSEAEAAIEKLRRILL